MSDISSCSAVDSGILQQVIHRIPGNTVQFKNEKQGFVDLSTKSKSDLLELIERQKKLLSKKTFINNLPDKGEKIKKYAKQLEEELRNRAKAIELSDMLLKLNINGKQGLDKLEWAGNCNPGYCKSVNNSTKDDIDDDEDADPLKIFATHSGTSHNKRINRIIPPEVSLIKPSDIEDAEEQSSGPSNCRPMDLAVDVAVMPNELDPSIEEPYIKVLCDKFDKHSSSDKQERFLPHKTLIHRKETKNDPKPMKPNWEVTAATPPPIVHESVKLISLEDSVKLQMQQADHLKEIQMKHATEKLKALSGQGIGTWTLPSKPGQFRNPRIHYDSSSSSSEEEDRHSYQSCNEEEDADEKIGGVTFYNLIDN